MVRPFFKTVDGTTHALSVTATSTAALQIAGQGSCVRISNVGTEAVAFRFGTSGVAAAVLPTAGSPTDCYVVLGGESATFRVEPDAYVRAIAGAAGPTVVYLVRGEGGI